VSSIAPPPPDPKPGSGYARDASLAAVARIAPLAVQLIATPFVIASAGVGAYAVWALLTTTISLMLTADLGVVGIMQRYHSIARGRGDAAMGGRVTATVLATLLVILVIVTALGPWIADAVLSVIQVAPGVRDAAWDVFRNAGTLSVLQLIGLALSSYLAAHSRFGAVAIASLGARSVSVVALIVVLSQGAGLPGLVVVAYLDATVAITLGVIFCWRHLVQEVRRFVKRDELRELWAYSWRNQASAIGFVAQRESDIIMAAVLLPAAMQATVAASAQLAASLAFAPTVLLVPLFTRLSNLAGTSPPRAIAESQRAETTWFALALPFSAIALAIGPFFASAWLGPALPEVTGVMAILSLGFLLVLANSVRAVLVRSIGRPGIETKSFGALLLVKLAIGIPATIFFGIYGLAVSTVFASISGVAVMWLLSGRSVPNLVAGTLKLRTVTASIGALVVGLASSLLVVTLVADRWLQLLALIILAIALSASVAMRILGRSWRNPTQLPPLSERK
jgi:O-antigen/teichoic acid export membrane protein